MFRFGLLTKVSESDSILNATEKYHNWGVSRVDEVFRNIAN
jgi:hypothetical protein